MQDYPQKLKEADNHYGFSTAPADGISRALSARYYKYGSEILIAQKNKYPKYVFTKTVPCTTAAKGDISV